MAQLALLQPTFLLPLGLIWLVGLGWLGGAVWVHGVVKLVLLGLS